MLQTVLRLARSHVTEHVELYTWTRDISLALVHRKLVLW